MKKLSMKKLSMKKLKKSERKRIIRKWFDKIPEVNQIDIDKYLFISQQLEKNEFQKRCQFPKPPGIKNKVIQAMNEYQELKIKKQYEIIRYWIFNQYIKRKQGRLMIEQKKIINQDISIIKNQNQNEDCSRQNQYKKFTKYKDCSRQNQQEKFTKHKKQNQFVQDKLNVKQQKNIYNKVPQYLKNNKRREVYKVFYQNIQLKAHQIPFIIPVSHYDIFPQEIQFQNQLII